jgi:hypothetical protein
MSVSSLRLDHLVIAARTLDEGCAYVADTLGVAPSGGGAHPLMRTHNRLLNLWGGLYLEVIAIDPDAPPPAEGAARPRLFALDAPHTQARVAAGPYLAHWVARVERPKDLRRWRAQYPQRLAPVVPMTRGALGWGLTVPDDGAFPAWQGVGDGLLPSLIQWDTPRHPSASLADAGLALKALRGVHPRADALAEPLRWLGAAHLITLSTAPDPAAAPALAADIETPAGLRVLR